MTDTVRPTPDGLSRRSLLGRGAAVGAGITLTGAFGTIFGSDSTVAGSDRARPAKTPPGYGPLVADPAGRLALPEGFSYVLVAESGVTTLETGEPTPDNPDGTASFEGRHGGSMLVNNHEIRQTGGNSVPHIDGLVYDTAPGAMGGTTNIEVDRHGNRIREYVSLAGTHINCAGGKTPWHTWLTCEETEALPPTDGLTQPHGYVFEVDPYDNGRNQNPKPIKALGRYAHEALAVDPKRHQIYLTEDATDPNGLVYRFTPPDSARPLRRGSLGQLGDTDGTLEAMRALDYGTLVPDLSVAQVGTTYDLEWVTVPDRDASVVTPPATTPVSTRKQFIWSGDPAAPGGGITRSRKLEGAWWGHGGAFIVASFARNAAPDRSAAQHDGQVWFLDPHRDTITLVLQFAYTPVDDDNDPDGPDNIAVSPYGGVIIAEDGDGKQHLVGADDRGKAFFFARNDLAGSGEMTGPNFSKDKKIMFANVYEPGHVFAITGPFRRSP